MYEDCFARGKGQCGILKETLCKTGKCRFYKSKKQYEADKEKYPTIGFSTFAAQTPTCGRPPFLAVRNAYKKKMEVKRNG